MGKKIVQSWQKMRKDHIPLVQLMDHFRLYSRTENKSPASVDWYDESLSTFLHWLRDEAGVFANRIVGLAHFR